MQRDLVIRARSGDHDAFRPLLRESSIGSIAPPG